MESGQGRAKNEKLLQDMQKQQRMKAGGSRRNGSDSKEKRANRNTKALSSIAQSCRQKKSLYTVPFLRCFAY